MGYKLISVLCLLIVLGASCVSQNVWKQSVQEFVVKEPEFKACHASTLVELTNQQIMAAWFGGSHEGNNDVVIWTSTLHEGQWSKPLVVATGVVSDTLRFPTWNPVLFSDRHGVVHLYYKVGANPREWWGMVISSRDNGKTWSAPRRLPDGILGPIKNKPIQLSNGVIVSPSSTETEKAWRSHIELSKDDGATWKYVPIDTSTTFDVIQPSILQYDDGGLQALCRSKEGYVMQSWSSDEGETWGKLTRTSLLNPNSGVDAVSLKSGEKLIIYNPDVPGKEWFNGRGRLRAAVSKNGTDWQDIAVLENGSKEEFSYPAVIQTGDGKVHVSYTYDRKNIKHVVLERTDKK